MSNAGNIEIHDDHAREASFSVWPHSLPIGPLVSGGFSCTNPDTCTVTCTTCGLEVDASSLNGTSPYAYHVQRSPGCLFFYPYRQESDRRQSFMYWIGYSGAPDIDNLVTAGFYVTEFGQSPVQCFCCDVRLLNNPADIRQEHARLSPDCVFIRSVMNH